MHVTTPETPNPLVTRSLIRRFEQVVGRDFVLNAPEVLATYECDACVIVKKRPDLVVLPANTQEVAAVVKICHEVGLPFIARGSGTGLSGGTLPMQGGVFIGLSRMNRILEIDPDNLTAVVETGVINAWLNREARGYNLFYAPDPSSQAACTIGGNIAENSGGIHCVKYGVTVDHILGLDVVTPEGEIVRLGGVHGHSKAVNWVGLFVGSEGTFGIATEAIVRLTPMPEVIKVYLASFTRVDQATDTVADIIASGLNPAALEFMDDVTIRAVNQAFDCGFPEDSEAVLLIEIDGTAQEVEIAQTRLLNMMTVFNVSQLRIAETEAERTDLWKVRKGAIPAYGRIQPAFYLHDCVIPRGELTRLLKIIQGVAKKYDVIIANVFHAGDGNLHPNILFDPADQAMTERVLAAGEEILQACIEVGGVLSGEHGIGMEKSEFMPLLFTEDELKVMFRLKAVFDPKLLANPEKIFPSRKSCGDSVDGLPHKILKTGAGWI
jgi:glycolate oxidase subunit GlcD